MKNHIWLKAGLSVIVFFGAFSFVRSLRNSCVGHDHFKFHNPAVGTAVPSSKLISLDGQEVDIEELIRGQKAILFFWSSTCPHCLKMLQEQEETKQQLESIGIKYISINSVERTSIVRNFLKRRFPKANAYVDPEGKLASALQVIGFPSYYFINEKGVLAQVGHDLTQDMIRNFKG